jgi:putative N6-adenine-specific DNA methylase
LEKYTAITFQGLEQILAEELVLLGAINVIEGRRTVFFEASPRVFYQVVYQVRTALKVLRPISNGTVQNETELYEFVKSFPWHEWIPLDKTFAIDQAIHSEIFTHSQFASLKVKDAIVDRIREETGNRPNVNRDTPDIKIHLHIDKDQIDISLDAGGEPLFKRGYRIGRVEAPLNEVMAAAIIKMTDWSPSQVLWDPFCGSGTIGLEAYMVSKNIPAQYLRENFGFMHWKDYDLELFESVKSAADEQIKVREPKVYFSDDDVRAITATSKNLGALKSRKYNILHSDFFNSIPPADEGWIITNPPYDERLSLYDAADWYRNLGSYLKHQCKGWKVGILTGSPEGLKAFGLKSTKRIPVMNGPIECRFALYDLF